jgi:hypothetical protein
MAWGKALREWDHTSVLQATIINVFRSKDAAVVHPKSLHPMLRNGGGGAVLDAETVRAIGKQLRKK